MLTQTPVSRYFSEKERQIKARVPTVLAHWGLRSKFTRWCLTQDPRTGLVVLFGVLNNQYSSGPTAIPFNDYFDPRLLLNLALDLNIPGVSSDREGFRYAFILDRGQLGQPPRSRGLPRPGAA